jgi:hypothetical protein
MWEPPVLWVFDINETLRTCWLRSVGIRRPEVRLWLVMTVHQTSGPR